MAAVYVAGIISMPGYWKPGLLAAVMASGLVAAFGNIINDIFDIELDRKAKPFRPLPSGQVGLNAARIAAISFAFITLAISALINIECLLIASVAIVFLSFYTSVFKGFGYWGNVLVAAVGSLAFFYGAAASGNLTSGWIPAIFAFLYHLIREIIKDMEDYSSDKEFGIQTGTVKYGMRLSKAITVIVIVFLVGISFIPFYAGIYKAGYLIVVLLGTDIPLVYIAIRLITAENQNVYRFLSGLMKALMPLGILAIFLGSRGF
jgi:geranylgeranylglycerol-phosphate geranylgeranyltransferase